MNKLKTTTTALILTTGLMALPASANETIFAADIASDIAEALVEQVVVVSEEMANELEISISESAEALWSDLTSSEAESHQGQQ